MLNRTIPLLALALTALPALAGAKDGLRHGGWDTLAADGILVDSRPLSDCLVASAPGARCLPAEEFFGPDGRLANFRDILWLLGTAGLDGNEAIAIFDDGGSVKDVVGAITYLAGQRSVTIVTSAPRAMTAAGRERATTRERVYQAPMRDDLIVLPHETAGAGTIVAANDRGALIRFAALDGREKVLLYGRATSVTSRWWWAVAATLLIAAGFLRWRKGPCSS